MKGVLQVAVKTWYVRGGRNEHLVPLSYLLHLSASTHDCKQATDPLCMAAECGACVSIQCFMDLSLETTGYQWL